MYVECTYLFILICSVLKANGMMKFRSLSRNFVIMIKGHHLYVLSSRRANPLMATTHYSVYEQLLVW
jgi:hypothetical protein